MAFANSLWNFNYFYFFKKIKNTCRIRFILLSWRTSLITIDITFTKEWKIFNYSY